MEGALEGTYGAFLAARREEILGRVRAAAERSGRDAGDVGVVAVSKTVGPDGVREAVGAGWRAFAENRPQELTRKLADLDAGEVAAGITFDMIGNLQTNKINQVVGRVRLVHSVSSERLARAVATRSAARGVTTRALLEVNVSGEASKSGLSPADAREALPRVLALEGLRVEGLMTMAPAHDPDAARRTFSGLRELAETLRADTGEGLATLSCGMSDDFEIAIEEGSTLVRLGRIVFDPGYRLRDD